jgi:6-phosphogluconolactonase
MIRIYPNRESLGEAAAELFATRAREAVEARGRFIVALAGGNTPSLTYELLAGPIWRDRIEWASVHVFWGDERCVPPTDPRSNELMARRALVDHVPVPPDQVHPIRCENAPWEAASRYQALIDDYFPNTPARFDLVILGLGVDGHTASLFPGSSVLSERKRYVAQVYLAEQEMCRVTLTVPLINQAATVVFLVIGSDKAQVLKQIIEDPPGPNPLPAQLIHPHEGELLWLVDQQAGALLKRDAEGESIESGCRQHES